VPCSSRATKAAILTAHHARNAADLATGVAVMTEVATAVAEAETVGTEARVTATADREMVGANDATLTATVAVHAPIATTMSPAMIEASAVHGDPPVAMMEAEDAQARRADVSSPQDKPG
jgi:hypothetical protein